MSPYVVTLTLVLATSLSLTDADLVPGHLTTVWWDEACGCRRVVVEARQVELDLASPFVLEEVADGG
jgi:hypothetical protein